VNCGRHIVHFSFSVILRVYYVMLPTEVPHLASFSQTAASSTTFEPFAPLNYLCFVSELLFFFCESLFAASASADAARCRSGQMGRNKARTSRACCPPAVMMSQPTCTITKAVERWVNTFALSVKQFLNSYLLYFLIERRLSATGPNKSHKMQESAKNSS